MKALPILLLAAFFAPAAAHATPTRILTIDNGNLIVPDDWDAAYYYSLAPAFKDHLYFDAYSTGKSLGWAFLDIKFGTLVIWFNKPFEASALYDSAIANGGMLGYSSTDFGSGPAWEPKETRLQAPDNKLALGYALPIADGLDLAFCFRLAQLDRKDEGSGMVGSLPAAYGPSAAEMAGQYPGLDVWRYNEQQASRGMVLSPQFSYSGEQFTLDAKLDLVWAGVDNRHSEDVVDFAGATGSVTQTLKEKGDMSWILKPRLRYMLGSESSLVLRGSYGKLGFNTEQRVQGSFSGGTLTAQQLGGYDFAAGTQDLAVDPWEAVLGMVRGFDKGKSLVVIGAGAKGESTKALVNHYQLRSAPANLSDVVVKGRLDSSTSKLELPVFMGAEISVAPWAKARGMVSRNFFAANDASTVKDVYDATGVLIARSTRKTSDDTAPAWTVAMGFGLEFGAFSWDTALNTGLLGSATGAAFVNPLYQSSFSYGF